VLLSYSNDSNLCILIFNLELTMGQSLCLLSCNSSHAQNTDATSETTAKEKSINNDKLMFQKKRQQQGPNRHRTSKHRTFTKLGAYVKTMWIKFVHQDQGVFELCSNLKNKMWQLTLQQQR